MSVYIKVDSCRACPHWDHQGGFGKISYVPYCGKENRELPFTPVVGKRGNVVASGMDIPDWCPLPKTEEPSLEKAQGMLDDASLLALEAINSANGDI
jgi:hypothetical protein